LILLGPFRVGSRGFNFDILGFAAPYFLRLKVLCLRKLCEGLTCPLHEKTGVKAPSEKGPTRPVTGDVDSLNNPDFCHSLRHCRLVRRYPKKVNMFYRFPSTQSRVATLGRQKANRMIQPQFSLSDIRSRVVRGTDSGRDCIRSYVIGSGLVSIR